MVYRMVTLSRSDVGCRVSVSRYADPSVIRDTIIPRQYFQVSLASQKRFERLVNTFPPNFQNLSISLKRIEISVLYWPDYFKTARRYGIPDNKLLGVRKKADVVPAWAVGLDSFQSDKMKKIHGGGYWGELKSGGKMQHLFISKVGQSDLCISACRAVVTDCDVVDAPKSLKKCIICSMHEADSLDPALSGGSEVVSNASQA